MKIHRSVLFFVFVWAATAFGQGAINVTPLLDRLKVDYVFLIDISGSMSGQGGHKNIFPSVLDAAKRWISKLDPGTEVYIVPFAESVRDTRVFVTHGAGDQEEAIAYLYTLKANGSMTGVYRSIQSTMDYINTRRGDQHRNDRPVVLFIYTDGDDNVSVGITLKDVLDSFHLKRGDYDWLFYRELGLPADPAKEAAFESHKSDNAVYVSEKSGELHPIIEVQPLLRRLNFGNIMLDQSPSRYIQFGVRGAQTLPADFKMGVIPSFEPLRDSGVLAQVEPERFAIDPHRNSLKLTLSNIEGLPHGKYRGKLQLTPSDKMVVVVPDEIDAEFSFEPPKSVDISAPPGERFPLNFGVLASGVGATRHLRLAFNDEARAAKANIRVQIQEAHSNPASARIGQVVSLDGFRGKTDVNLDSTANEVTVVVRPSDELLPGNYSGTIEVSSPTAQIDSSGRKPAAPNEAMSFPWSFTVPKPTPWGLIILIVAIVIALAVYLWRRAIRPPTFTDLTLMLLAPTVGAVELRGQHARTLGRSTPELSDMPATMTIRSGRNGRRETATLEVTDGEVKIIRKDMRIDVFSSEELEAGDRIEAGPYKMRVESFRLGAED